MGDDVRKETERIHQGIVESLSFSEALAKRDAEIERPRGLVAKVRAEIAGRTERDAFEDQGWGP